MAKKPKARTSKTVQVLTQAQAHLYFPGRKYDRYDPMMLVVGSRKAVMAAFSITVNVNGKPIATTSGPQDPEAFEFNGDFYRDLYTVDVMKSRDYRVVVWTK